MFLFCFEDLQETIENKDEEIGLLMEESHKNKLEASTSVEQFTLQLHEQMKAVTLLTKEKENSMEKISGKDKKVNKQEEKTILSKQFQPE
jgi:hypothetical protein